MHIRDVTPEDAGSVIALFQRLYSETSFLLYDAGEAVPHVEDFGLMPLEAAACGTPTLAQGRGGALETVVPGVTGQLFPEATINTIKESLVNWGDTAWDAAAIQSHAAKFSKEVFQKKLGDFVEAVSNKEVTSNV